MSTELLNLARRIALQAGALAAKRRREGVSVAASKSSDVDIVTAADRETEALIRSLIAAERPDDAFYGEESDATAGSSGLVWVVDPIDGTVNYLYGNPAWAVSIAVGELAAGAEAGADAGAGLLPGAEPTAAWRALAGVVYAPASGELYSATADGGAWLEQIDHAGPSGSRSETDAERLRVSTGVVLAHALIGTGFSYTAPRRAAQAEVLRTLLPQLRDIRRGGSAALDLCSVASGRLDGYYERHLNPWDHAAGALIAAEAGARVAGLHGAPATGELLIAAEPALFAQLHDTLAERE